MLQTGEEDVSICSIGKMIRRPLRREENDGQKSPENEKVCKESKNMPLYDCKK